jgi:hypothetical protein
VELVVGHAVVADVFPYIGFGPIEQGGGLDAAESRRDFEYAGVSTSSAPRACKILRRSMLMDSGMVRIRRYPFTADTRARPMPVLPDVGSMMVAPSLSFPSASAASIMARAMRSFTLEPGLKDFRCRPGITLFFDRINWIKNNPVNRLSINREVRNAI